MPCGRKMVVNFAQAQQLYSKILTKLQFLRSSKTIFQKYGTRKRKKKLENFSVVRKQTTLNEIDDNEI